MLLVHTDFGRSLIEGLAAANPDFDPLFFADRALLNVSAAMNYYEDAVITYGGSTYNLQVRFSVDPSGTRVFDTIEIFDSSYQKVASLSYINIPTSAGSLSYLDDKLYLTGADDVVYDGGGTDIIDLSIGNDEYHYASGNDQILGGPGQDVVYVATERGDAISARDGSDFVVTLGESSLTLNNVERIEFTDGAQLGFDVGQWQNAGAAYRLYQAAFDRVPDDGGLAFWIDALDSRIGDLSWVAANFIASAEFQSTYGTPATIANADFVDLLYQNVLDRAAEGAGAEFWQNQLVNGMDRSAVLLNFSESPENQANVAAFISDGIWF